MAWASGFFQVPLGEFKVQTSLKATGWEKRFSSLNMHQDHLGIWLNWRFWFGSPGVSLRFLLSTRLLMQLACRPHCELRGSRWECPSTWNIAPALGFSENKFKTQQKCPLHLKDLLNSVCHYLALHRREHCFLCALTWMAQPLVLSLPSHWASGNPDGLLLPSAFLVASVLVTIYWMNGYGSPALSTQAYFSF